MRILVRILVNVPTIVVLTPIVMVFKPPFVFFFLGIGVIKAMKAGDKVPFFGVFLFFLLTPLSILITAFNLLFGGGAAALNPKEIFYEFLVIGD